MPTIINKKTQKEITQRKLEQYEKYCKILQWGRAYPIEFSERFMGFDYLDFQRYMVYNTWFSDFALWLLARNGSKSLPLNTNIPTPFGVKKMSDIHIGDYVYNELGLPVKVVNESEIKLGDSCSEITFDGNESMVVSDEHLWAVQPRYLYGQDNYKNGVHSKIYHGYNIDEYGCIVMQTRDIAKKYFVPRKDKKGNEYLYRIPMASPIQNESIILPIDPYVLGVWIGDGMSDSPVISSHKDDVKEIEKYIRSSGYNTVIHHYKSDKTPRLAIICDNNCRENKLFRCLKDLNLINNKHIPDIFLHGSVEQRLELLRGLMDTDGTTSNNGKCCFAQKRKSIVDSFVKLLTSLGIKYSISERVTQCNGKNFNSYSVYFCSSKEKPCFKMKRKYDKLPEYLAEQHKWKTITSIKSVPSVAVKCIAVDSPRQLFLCGDTNIVTHNTTVAAMYTMLRSMLLPKHISYFLGNTGDQAKEVFKKVEKIAKNEISTFVGGTDIFLNELVLNGSTSDGFTHLPSSFNATLFNGSEINTLNSDIINIKGKRANLVFFDEAGWMSDELFIQAGHFTDQDENFRLGAKIEIGLEPKNFTRQLIYASSASDTSSEYYKKFKTFAQSMIMGDKKYFVCNFDIDTVLGAKHLGEAYPPLISKSKVDEAMENNPEKGARELYNKFSADTHEGQILTRRELMQCTTHEPPVLQNAKGDKKYIIAWDSARLNDNSVIAIAEIYQDENGYKMKVVNLVSLVDIGTKKKTPMIIPDQVEKFKSLLLNYNGTEAGRLDYENIIAVICDSGAGGQMLSVSDYMLGNWEGSDGKEHKGIIDREHKANETTGARFPDAVNIMKLIDPKAHRNDVFDAAERMTKLGVVSFPAEYENKDMIITIKDDGTEDIYELSSDEQISLAQITRMKDEIITMCKYVSGGNVTYNFPPEKRNTMHDDRVFVYGLLCWYLAELRRGQIRKPPKESGDIKELLNLYRAPVIK